LAIGTGGHEFENGPFFSDAVGRVDELHETYVGEGDVVRELDPVAETLDAKLLRARAHNGLSVLDLDSERAWHLWRFFPGARTLL
jgi:hypothetical protein